LNTVLLLFYAFGFLAVMAAAYIVFTRNVLYAAFGLLVTLLCLAAIFVLLFADFVALTQLMVYVGGVLVLILFGIMLSNRVADRAIQSESVNLFSGALVAGVLSSWLIYFILEENNFLELPAPEFDNTAVPAKSSITALGIRLITNFALPFEVTSLILLIALMGAAYISTPDKHD